MSVPNEGVTHQSKPAGSAGRLAADGRRVYRTPTALVIWWAWVAVLVFSLGDLLIQGRDFISLQFALGTLTATGLVYACTLWSKVIAGEGGIAVLNPLRRFDIPWGAVKGIYLADSVEVVCARAGSSKDKTIYSWALAAPRRARARAQLRGRQWETGHRSKPTDFNRIPGQARELVKMTTAEVIARELAGLSEQAWNDQERTGAGAAVMSAKWALPPLAAILIPGVAFTISMLIR